ncbi:MAG: hypothetical protein ACLQME_14010, partial [Alphaproteobacteria bacterium]
RREGNPKSQENASQAPLSCKIDYSITPKSDSRSTAWAIFTDDQLKPLSWRSADQSTEVIMADRE